MLTVLLVQHSFHAVKRVSLFKWQYGAGPVAGAGAKIRREKNVELELSL